MKRIILTALLLLLGSTPLLHALTPDGTYLFAKRDTCDLFLDVYNPPVEAETTFEGKAKPTILYVFGGGFITGRRNDPYLFPWFRELLNAGYRIVSVDYRLGLKGVQMRFDALHLIESAKLTKRAVDMGVEDVFSAVKYLIDNQDALEIDPRNIVIAGSSAGAMISLSSEWEACNHSALTAELPDDFHFAGVMSFAGAVMSLSGVPQYARTPAPQLLFHGTNDGAVVYDKKAFGKFGMFGSSGLVEKSLEPKGYIYRIYRYKGHSHDMASNMFSTLPEQFRFLQEEVLQARGRILDAMVDDPAMPVGKTITLDDIYKKR